MDNVLCIHKDTDKYLKLAYRDFHPKDPPECPTMYLGANISKFVILNDGNGVTCWATIAYIHVKKELQVFEAKPKEVNVRWKLSNKTADHSLSIQSYRPKLEMTKGCNNDQIQFYHILVGIMRWLCKIGRINILTDTSLLLIYLLESRVGNMHQALHLFKYLKDHKCSKHVFYPNYVDIADNQMPVKNQATSR